MENPHVWGFNPRLPTWAAARTWSARRIWKSSSALPQPWEYTQKRHSTTFILNVYQMYSIFELISYNIYIIICIYIYNIQYMYYIYTLIRIIWRSVKIPYFSRASETTGVDIFDQGADGAVSLWAQQHDQYDLSDAQPGPRGRAVATVEGGRVWGGRSLLGFLFNGL